MNIEKKLMEYGLTEQKYLDLLQEIQDKKDGLIDEDWQDICNKYELNLNPDSLRKANDTIVGGYFVRQFLAENGATEKDKRELFIATQKYRDIVNEYKALMREQSRAESMNEIIERAFEKRKDKLQQEFTVNKVENKDKEIVVAFADVHLGADFCIKDFKGNIMNEYNPTIVKQRFQQLFDEIVEFANLNNTFKLNIVDQGDSIEGVLHLSQVRAMRSDVVDDIIDYADIVCDFVTSLTNAGFVIDMYTSNGNHSDLRLLTGKKGDFPHENLEKIYWKWLNKCTQGNPNITLHANLDGLNYFNVQGYNIMTAHGQNERNVKNSIKEYEDTYNIDINYFMVGHLHCKNEIEVAKGKEVIQVRSMMGINEYSQTIKKTSEAGAIMFTVEKGYGKHYVNDVKFR